MPRPAPLAMPIQPWHQSEARPDDLATSPAGITWRRALLIGLTALIGLIGGLTTYDAAAGGGIDWREALLIMLFVPLFAWIGFGFLVALIGFVLLLRGRSSSGLELVGANVAPFSRTAVLLPVYNEDIDAVCGRIRRMARSLGATGHQDRFDFFILSDSNPDNGRRERLAFLELRREIGPRLYYRRRPRNIERKPGNIADWVRNHGAAYPHMVVLDADSLICGETLTRLAATMDANPGVGLIQTIPTVIGGSTLFARWQQFAARLYGPVSATGMIWWSGAESSFWGHNAIVRTRAFAESCGLAPLSGREPFGGAIMSHDMVEAALLRRNGWAVHMVEAEQSYEEYPPTLVDHAIRDRRWFQGNLQHVRLLNAAGFHWVNRLQLLMGSSAYLTSPMWFLMLVVTLVHHYVGSDGRAAADWLLGMTVVILFGPKLLAIVWALLDRRRAAGFGGARRILASALVEFPLSVVVAPLTMMTQTLMLLDILRGKRSGWAAQRRDVEKMGLGEAVRFYRCHLAAGLLMTGLALAGGGALLWMLPVSLGLLLSPLVAMATSRRTMGEYFAKHGLFLIPEEVHAEQIPLLKSPRPIVIPEAAPAWRGHLPTARCEPALSGARAVARSGRQTVALRQSAHRMWQKPAITAAMTSHAGEARMATPPPVPAAPQAVARREGLSVAATVWGSGSQSALPDRTRMTERTTGMALLHSIIEQGLSLLGHSRRKARALEERVATTSTFLYAAAAMDVTRRLPISV